MGRSASLSDGLAIYGGVLEEKNSFDGDNEVRSGVRRGVLSLRVVLQMLT